MMQYRMRSDFGAFTHETRVALYQGREIGRAPGVPELMALVREHAYQNRVTLPNDTDYVMETYNVRKIVISQERVER